MSRTFSGLKDWAIQRVTAIYMAIYLFMLLGYFIVNPNVQYNQWVHFFELIWVQVASLICLICMVWHAWIGIWTVLTDYVKIPFLNIVLQVLIVLGLLACLIWGVQIIWHVRFIW